MCGGGCGRSARRRRRRYARGLGRLRLLGRRGRDRGGGSSCAGVWCEFLFCFAGFLGGGGGKGGLQEEYAEVEGVGADLDAACVAKYFAYSIVN